MMSCDRCVKMRYSRAAIGAMVASPAAVLIHALPQPRSPAAPAVINPISVPARNYGRMEAPTTAQFIVYPLERMMTALPRA